MFINQTLRGSDLPKVEGLLEVRVVKQSYSLLLVFMCDVQVAKDMDPTGSELKQWANEWFPRRAIHLWTQHLNDGGELDGFVLVLSEDGLIIAERKSKAAKSAKRLDELMAQHDQMTGFKLYMDERRAEYKRGGKK